MLNVADIVSEELKKHVKHIFMLTGYGAMYLNDSVERAGIKFIASRNEAAAPMMAEAYAKINKNIGAVCVTAGPGSTNAIPGLAEAYVDSAPIVIISGQVESKFTTDKYKNYKIRSFGVAEFSISEAIKKFSKHSKTINDPYLCLYELQKAIYIAKSGRPGPVWIEIPLDIQSFKIKSPKNLKKFVNPKQKTKNLNHKEFFRYLEKSKRPVLLFGNGIKQSNSESLALNFAKLCDIPFMLSRFANDICPYSNKLNLGQVGIKGQPYNSEIINKSDLVISFGCRFAPTLTMGNPKNFAKNAKKIMIDIDKISSRHPLLKIDKFFNYDLNFFLKSILKKIKLYNIKSNNKNLWKKYCQKTKLGNQIEFINNSSNPIDLYHFMYTLNKLSKKSSIFTNDAGSNYYVGGQAWHYEKKQIEIASSTNAAMGLSLPLSIGAAIARPKNQIISVTGDGSIELNIQELKTISHYNLNIKTFVINNGGYASMTNWQDTFFEGNRLDTAEKTGVGTLNFKKIAEAYNLKYQLIKKSSEIQKKISKILNDNDPYLVEVVTKKNQKIIGTEIG